MTHRDRPASGLRGWSRWGWVAVRHPSASPPIAPAAARILGAASVRLKRKAFVPVAQRLVAWG